MFAGVHVPDLTLVLAFTWIYSRPSGDVGSVEEDIHVDYEGIYGDFVNLKNVPAQSLGGAHRGRVYMRPFIRLIVCLCI